MPIRPPALDDRSFDDLVTDLVRRIPAHTPEWTNPREGDPGLTLIDLFAWLGDTILYRANLIPERQRLAFLRLLGSPMRPAVPAKGLLQLSIDDPNVTAPVELPMHQVIDKPVPFETESEITVHAVEGRCYLKRRMTSDEATQLRQLLPDLRDLYGVTGTPQGYVTTPVFANGKAEPAGIDVAATSLDHCLWFALLAGKGDPAQVEATRAELGGGSANRRRVLNIGVAPALAIPTLSEDVGIRARVPHMWEASTPNGDGEDYLPLEVIGDSSAGLTRAGVVRLLLPGSDDMGAPSNDVLRQLRAGVGDRPPRIDDADVAARLVAWIRLRPDPAPRVTSLRLAWAGINAVAIEQRRTLGRQTIGHGTGASDLELSLGAASVEPDSLAIEVEEEEGMRMWRGPRRGGGRARRAGLQSRQRGRHRTLRRRGARPRPRSRPHHSGGAHARRRRRCRQCSGRGHPRHRGAIERPAPQGHAAAADCRRRRCRKPRRCRSAHSGADPARRPCRDGRRLSRAGAAHAGCCHRPHRSARALQAAPAARRRARRGLRDGAAGAPGHRRTRAATRSSVA
jgi:hypothetical protein